MTRFPVARGRIQRNRRPHYNYVNPATLKPLERRAMPRAQALPVGGNTSEPSRDDANRARAHQMQFLKEDIIPENVHLVSTIQLLRCRARTIRAHYKRMWEVTSNQKPAPFVWHSPERDGDDETTSRNVLRKYIADHVVQIERLRKQVECCAKKKHQLYLRNRSGGERHRMWQATNRAIMQELVKRGDDYELLPVSVAAAVSIPSDVAQANVADRVSPVGLNSARAQTSSNADSNINQVSQATAGPSRQQYPRQYAVDVQRIERDMEADELGLSKPSRKQKITAAMVAAMAKGDMQEARSRQDHLNRINAQERMKAKRKRIRKRAIKQAHRDYANRDPNSDAERDGSAPAPTAA